MNWMEWYDSLAKPSWTPAPSTIGLIWSILYPVIIVTFGFVFVQAFRLSEMPLDENPYADWSSNLFTADRTQYIIITNTNSLYSCVMYGRGISDDSVFIERALSSLREFTEYDGQAFVYQKFIAPSSGTVSFAKALNRSVTGSMNDMIYHAKMWLIEEELSPFDVGFKLNEMPMSALEYANPKDAFKKLADD